MKSTTKRPQFFAMHKDFNDGTVKPYNVLTAVFNEKLSELKSKTVKEQERIHNLFTLMSKAFGDESNEMLIAVTELTVHKQSAEFFATFGSEDYNRYNEILMVTDRKDSLRQEILSL